MVNVGLDFVVHWTALSLQRIVKRYDDPFASGIAVHLFGVISGNCCRIEWTDDTPLARLLVAIKHDNVSVHWTALSYLTAVGPYMPSPRVTRR